MAKSRNIVRDTGGVLIPDDYYQPFMSVYFKKGDILSLISDENVTQARDKTFGVMLRRQISSDGEYLDMVKIKNRDFSEYFSSLEALSKNQTVAKKDGQIHESGRPDSFYNPTTLSLFNFAIFKIDIINDMLSVIGSYPNEDAGLIFKLVLIEIGYLGKHISLAVSPSTIANPVADRTPETDASSPKQEFMTYSIGFVCPPVWPPNKRLLLDIPSSFVSHMTYASPR